MTYGSALWTGQDRQNVEETFRIYMDILDRHIDSGHISNWTLSELTGAVYCAMVLQDFERMGIGRYPRKGDSFTEQNCKDTRGHLQEPLKKTVSFSSGGREAGFITVLEAGKKTGRICGIRCTDFRSIIVEEADGSKWEIAVEGMDEKEAEIAVEIKKAGL